MQGGGSHRWEGDERGGGVVKVGEKGRGSMMMMTMMMMKVMMMLMLMMMMMMMVMMIIHKRGWLHASPASSSPEYSHISI